MISARIGYCNEDGNIVSVICDCDDDVFTSSLAHILKTYYKTYDKIKKLVDKGNILDLGRTPKTTTFIDKTKPEEDFSIGSYILNCENSGCECAFLFDDDNTWKVMPSIENIFCDL